MKTSQRTWVGRVASFLLLIVVASTARGEITKPAISAVVRIGVTVEDMDRSIDFYTKVLDFKQLSDDEVAGEKYEQLFGVFGLRARIVQLRLGEETIELTQYLTPRGRVVPRDSRSNDRWFQHIAIVTSDMDRAYQRLREHKVRHASTGPQTLPEWNKNAGGIRAFYFHDPDDHVLEVIWFPSDKGNPRWQKSKELFAGIDHTAIVVADTEKALAFYRDVLGMKVVGESENYGTEQAHLNNVEGARLRITSLRAAMGPGVEFLEYLSPKEGRAYPAEAQANDLFHWQTIVTTRQPEDLYKRVRECGYGTVSKNALQAADKSVLVRDRDGHAVMVIEQ